MEGCEDFTVLRDFEEIFWIFRIVDFAKGYFRNNSFWESKHVEVIEMRWELFFVVLCSQSVGRSYVCVYCVHPSVPLEKVIKNGER